MTNNHCNAAANNCCDGLRYVHHIAIGVKKNTIPPYKLEEASRNIQLDLTRLLGGVTVWLSEGTWSAFSEFGNYAGAIERDVTLNLLLTMTSTESERVWSNVQSAITDTVLKHGLGAEHIHVMFWPAHSRIFRVSDIALGSDIPKKAANANAPEALPASNARRA